MEEACPLEALLDRIGGKWKVVILWWVMDGPRRFSELRRLMPGVTQKVLTQQLRELARDGLVARTAHATMPVRVEYEATALGRSLRPVLAAMHEWAKARLPGTAT
ncbi:MAG: helix-turn-helix transcriptional regulator [Gemmataceae bacterium]|nr:helix-turn-helix transcriptional regulator [Gemmataceae bacterium]